MGYREPASTPVILTSEVLTPEEERFCVMYSLGYSLREAYISNFGQRRDYTEGSHELLQSPRVVRRLEQMQVCYNNMLGITRAGHLDKLAEIRDIALERDQAKVALDAEKARGEIAGYYNRENIRTIDVTEAGSITVESLGALHDDDLKALSTLVGRLKGSPVDIDVDESPSS